MANQNLTNAKIAKKDEFYTRWEEIEKEVNAYLEYNHDVFKNKTILLPADDPFESNFFKYFAVHFNDFGLKKLIATSYDSSPIVNTQLSLFDSEENNISKKFSKAYKIELTHVDDFDHDGRFNIEDIEQFLNNEKLKLNNGNKSKVLSYLKGDSDPDGISRFVPGDFRSQEVTKLRDEADIIITNPPFSLFRDFIKWVNPKEKQILVIGNINAVTYKEIFPLIKENCLWLGATNFNTGIYFYVPKDFKYKKSYKFIKEIDGKKVNRVPGTCWFTNLNHGRRHQPLSLMSMADNIKFSKHKQVRDNQYQHYINYDAIEIPFTDAIPSDYKEVMGVPITFLDKYNPAQFEILGMCENKDLYHLKTRVFTTEECHKAYYDKFHKKGTYDLNASGVILKNGKFEKVYQRILIKAR